MVINADLHHLTEVVFVTALHRQVPYALALFGGNLCQARSEGMGS